MILSGTVLSKKNRELLLICIDEMRFLKMDKLEKRKKKYQDDGEWSLLVILEKLNEELVEFLIEDDKDKALLELCDLSNVIDILYLFTKYSEV